MIDQRTKVMLKMTTDQVFPAGTTVLPKSPWRMNEQTLNPDCSQTHSTWTCT
jgi:hypothetical protein